MRDSNLDNWLRLSGLGLAMIVVGAAIACGGPSDNSATRPQPVVKPPQGESVKPPTAERNVVKEPELYTVSLSGDSPSAIAETELTAHISGSFHKVRAPLVGVSILVSHGSDKKAEVSWRIESGKIDSQWLAVEGRRYDDDSGTYVDEAIPGWQVRLDSVDDSSAGGNPTAITVSFRRAPAAATNP